MAIAKSYTMTINTDVCTESTVSQLLVQDTTLKVEIEGLKIQQTKLDKMWKSGTLYNYRNYQIFLNNYHYDQCDP